MGSESSEKDKMPAFPPLKNETFTRKEEIGNRLVRQWEALREEDEDKDPCDGDKHKRISRLSYRRVAAGVAAVFVVSAIILFNAGKVEYTASAEHLHLSLPDGSEVILMDNSGVRYNKITWRFKRDISLIGKAEFSVIKGKEFRVKTGAGNIVVLGTRFYAEQNGKDMIVRCYEGSVRVENSAGSVILNAGDSVNVNPTGITPAEEPAPEYMNFSSSSLLNVVNAIEAAYNIEFYNKEYCGGMLFSGMVSTRNLAEALDVVFGSCNFDYSISGGKVEIKQK